MTLHRRDRSLQNPCVHGFEDRRVSEVRCVGTQQCQNPMGVVRASTALYVLLAALACQLAGGAAGGGGGGAA